MAEINNWRELNDALRTATEDQCLAMLKAERESDARPTFMNRIYGRFSVMRMRRERKELFGKEGA